MGPKKLALLFGLVPALALVMLAADIGSGGHPPLSAVLISWAIYPTLTGYLSRAFLGSYYPSSISMLFGALEYPLVGFGLGSVLARLKAPADHRTRVGVIAFVLYITVQLAAHAVLNLQSVNLKLVANASPSVSEAAVERIARSGDSAALPTLQQKLVTEFGDRGFAGATLLDTLTQVGGAKGWQDLLDSGRLGIAGREARAWRSIIDNVREMTNPLYADPRGGVTSPYLRDEDVTRLVDALALKLARHLEVTPDSEAALTLLTLMRERSDLCSKYLETVPNGLRDRISQATYAVVGNLAAIKSGQPPDGRYNYQVYLSKEEIFRIAQEQTLIADEWAAWAKSDASPCRT